MHFSVSVDFTNLSFNGAWNVVPFYLESLAGSETVLWLRYIMEGRFYSQFFRLYLSRLLRCAAARLVSRAPRYCHVTSSLRELHWLPVRQRINYKILLLTFKTIHGKTPVYLQELISVNMPGAIRLRSSPSVVSYLNRHLFELEPPWAIGHFQ